MKLEFEEQLRAAQQRLREGIEAVRQEAREAEQDTVEFARLTASVNARLGTVHPDAPEAAALITDVARLAVFQSWEARRSARRDALAEKLDSTVRVAAFELRDALAKPAAMFAFENLLTRDTALSGACEAVAEIDRQIAYVPPPPVAPRPEPGLWNP